MIVSIDHYPPHNIIIIIPIYSPAAHPIQVHYTAHYLPRTHTTLRHTTAHTCARACRRRARTPPPPRAARTHCCCAPALPAPHAARAVLVGSATACARHRYPTAPRLPPPRLIALPSSRRCPLLPPLPQQPHVARSWLGSHLRSRLTDIVFPNAAQAQARRCCSLFILGPRHRHAPGSVHISQFVFPRFGWTKMVR